MLEVTGRRKTPATYKAGRVVLRVERPKIGSRYVKPPPSWQTTITEDQLWIQDVYLGQPVSQWTWVGRWSNALRLLTICAVVFVCYHAGRWVQAGMPSGY